MLSIFYTRKGMSYYERLLFQGNISQRLTF